MQHIHRGLQQHTAIFNSKLLVNEMFYSLWISILKIFSFSNLSSFEYPEYNIIQYDNLLKKYRSHLSFQNEFNPTAKPQHLTVTLPNLVVDFSVLFVSAGYGMVYCLRSWIAAF